jgi:hypothetical protein
MMRLVKMAIAISVLFFAASLYLNWSNRDIKALSESRHAALTTLRPVLLRYKADTEKFPSTLEALIPKYLSQIPVVLQEQAETEAARRIRYESDGETAKFTYHLIRGPDSTEVFDVTKNTYTQNR